MENSAKTHRETLLKRYAVQSIDYIDSIFPASDLKGLILDYSELFSLESHEPENFKKNLVSETDHALMPVTYHSQHIPSPKFKPKFYDEKKTLYSPFEATGLTQNRLDEKLWFYLDEDAFIRGPYSTIDMDRWFNHGELHGSTKVAYDQKEKFCKIYKFVEIFHEFERKHDEQKKSLESNNSGSETQKFKKFGFVNQNKGKSAGNSPLLGKNSLAQDPIDEDNDENHNYKDPKKNFGFFFIICKNFYLILFF